MEKTGAIVHIPRCDTIPNDACEKAGIARIRHHVSATLSRRDALNQGGYSHGLPLAQTQKWVSAGGESEVYRTEQVRDQLRVCARKYNSEKRFPARKSYWHSDHSPSCQSEDFHSSFGGSASNPSSYRAYGLNNSIRVGELSRRELGMEFLSISRDFKRAASARDELEGADVLLEFEKFLRQTDGVRLVVSSSAIFNGDVESHSYVVVLA